VPDPLSVADPDAAGHSRRVRLLAAMFATSGVLHFVVPRIFEAIVPSWLPAKRALVYLSGAAELGCAAGLLTEAAWAGPASAGLLLAVWPANIQMAVDETRQGNSLVRRVGLWGRVPLQVPMIRTALSAPRG
jgi:uncharacterized membrane protein